MNINNIFGSEYINVRCAYYRSSDYCANLSKFSNEGIQLFSCIKKFKQRDSNFKCSKFQVDWITYILYNKHFIINKEV